MQSLARRSRSDLMFNSGTSGLVINGAPAASASHLSDVIQGSNWIGTYGNAGYILPNTASGSLLNSTFQVIPSWITDISTSLTSSADTFSSNRPNKPDGSGTNDFWLSRTFSGDFSFRIPESDGLKKIAFYITHITSATATDQIRISMINRLSFVSLTANRTYNNGPTGTGISTVGGLVAQYQVSGIVTVSFSPPSSFGFINAIFFDN